MLVIIIMLFKLFSRVLQALFPRAFRALFLRNLIYRKRNWLGTVSATF